MATTAFEKKGVLIGCKDLVFAKLTKDDSTECTYNETLRSAPGVIEIALTAQNTSDTLGADDVALYEVYESNDGYEVSLTTAMLGNDMTAWLLGRTVGEDGVMIESADDNAPYVAAGFKAARSDGSYDYIWLYKGRFAQSDQTFRTKEQGTVNWQTPQLTGHFVPRQNDRKIMARVNDHDEAAAEILPTFFSAPYASATAAATGGETPATGSETPATGSNS